MSEEENDMILEPQFTEYKGHKLIVLRRSENDKYPFRFGKSKARLIVHYFDAIKKFAEEKDEKKEE